MGAPLPNFGLATPLLSEVRHGRTNSKPRKITGRPKLETEIFRPRVESFNPGGTFWGLVVEGGCARIYEILYVMYLLGVFGACQTRGTALLCLSLETIN